MRRDEREITDSDIIKSIIQKCDVCRIAISNGETPYLVAMNFGYTDYPERRLYFHCANEGRKIDMIRKNNYVCFAMDTDHNLYGGEKGCDWGMKFSSVVGYGYITIITDAEEKCKALDIIMTHYAGKGDYTYDEKVLSRTTILSLAIKEITGKKY